MSTGRLCSKCGNRHSAPTGKKCQREKESGSMEELLAGMRSIQSTLGGLSSRVSSLESNAAADHRNNGPSDSEASSMSQATGASLQGDQGLQKAVRQRMKECNLVGSSTESSSEETCKPEKKRVRKSKVKKSGRVRTNEEVIVQNVEWPHFHVYRGASRDPASFDDLQTDEFVYGYLQDVLETCENMLQHLLDLMGDSLEYGWKSARNSHGVILQKMEAGRLSWKSMDGLAQVRSKYSRLRPADQGLLGQGLSLDASAKNTQFKGPLFCIPFQEGRCKESGDHDTNRGRVLHVCAYCCKHGFAHRHAESECRRKTADSQQ